MDSVASLLKEERFEDLFVEVLGWDRLRGRESVRLIAAGQVARGWASTQDRRHRDSLRHNTFSLIPIAQKRGQVVFRIQWMESEGLPDAMTRYAVARRVAKTHYEPLLVFSAPNTVEQVWVWAASRAGDLEFYDHRFDPSDPLSGIADRLRDLEFCFSDEETLTAHEVQRRLSQALRYVRVVRSLVRREVDPEAFAPFGDALSTMARLALRHRGLEREEERLLVKSARDGDRRAHDRLFLAHLYLPLSLSLRRWEKHPFVGMELADLVQASVVGLLRALRGYDFTQSPRLQTYASLWIRQTLDRACRDYDRQIAIPNYIDEKLLLLVNGFDINRDRLAQSKERSVTFQEVADALGMSEADACDLLMIGQTFVPLETREFADEVPPQHSTWTVSPKPDAILDSISEMSVMLDTLKPKQREVLLFRSGLHPMCLGEEKTLEETANILGITRERVRQIQIQATDALRKAMPSLETSRYAPSSSSRVPSASSLAVAA